MSFWTLYGLSRLDVIHDISEIGLILVGFILVIGAFVGMMVHGLEGVDVWGKMKSLYLRQPECL